MNDFVSRRRWAVLVMIGWLAVVISVWAIDLAGRWVLDGSACAACRGVGDPCALKNKGLFIELAQKSSRRVEDFLAPGRAEGRCIVSWLAARYRADFLLIPAYSGLMAFIFLFLSARRDADDRTAVRRSWVAAGLLVAVGMLVADLAENRWMLRWLGPGLKDDRFLHLSASATEAKWWAIALACALAGVLALVKRSGWMSVLIGLVGLSTGVLLVAGQGRGSVPLLSGGVAGLSLFLLLVMIHAVATVVQPDVTVEKGGNR